MGIEEDFLEFKEREQTSPGFREFRPGQRVEDEFAEFKRRQRESQASQRMPIGATALGTAASLYAYHVTKNPGLAAAAGSIGSGTGEVLQNVTETIFDLPTKPKSGLEAAQRIGKETFFGSLAEAGGQLATRAVGRTGLFRFFSESVTPEAKEAIQFLAPRDVQPPVLPAQATESRALDLLNNMAEHSLIGGGTISAKRLAEEAQHGHMADEFLNALAKDIAPDEAAKLFVQSSKQQFRIKTWPAQFFYNTVKAEVAPTSIQVTRKQQVPTGLFDASGNEIMREVPTKGTQLVGGLRSGLKSVKNFVQSKVEVQERLNEIGADVVGGSLLKRINEMPALPYTSDLIELRSLLRATRQSMEMGIETKKAPAIGIIKKIEGMIDRSIEQSLDAFNPTALALWRTANKIWKEGSQQFNNRIIRRAAQMADFENRAVPEDVVKLAFASGKATRMGIMKNAVTPKAWDKIARAGMSDIVEKATDRNTGQLVGSRLQEALIGRTGLGEKGLTTAVGPIEAQRWIQLSNAMKVRQAKQAVGEGSMFIQLSQAGAVVTTLSGIASGEDVLTTLGTTGGLLLLSPALIAKGMTNPRVAKALIEGLSVDQKASVAHKVGIALRIAQGLFPRQTETAKPRVNETLEEELGRLGVEALESGRQTLLNITPALTR